MSILIGTDVGLSLVVNLIFAENITHIFFSKALFNSTGRRKWLAPPDDRRVSLVWYFFFPDVLVTGMGAYFAHASS